MPIKKAQEGAQGPIELRKAYLHMIQQPGVWSRLKQGKQTVMNRRVTVKRGTFPKDTVMRAQLARTGWRKVIEEQWERIKETPGRSGRSSSALRKSGKKSASRTGRRS